MPRKKGKTPEPTLKQKKFTAEYLKSGNATQAAKNAGYSEKYASQIGAANLQRKTIKESIESATEKLGIDPEYVLNNFKRVSEVHSKLVTKTLGSGENVYVVEEMVDANAVIKSNEMLGKHLQLFVEKTEVEHTGKIELDDKQQKTLLAKKLLLALKNPEILNNI